VSKGLGTHGCQRRGWIAGQSWSPRKDTGKVDSRSRRFTHRLVSVGPAGPYQGFQVGRVEQPEESREEPPPRPSTEKSFLILEEPQRGQDLPSSPASSALRKNASKRWPQSSHRNSNIGTAAPPLLMLPWSWLFIPRFDFIFTGLPVHDLLHIPQRRLGRWLPRASIPVGDHPLPKANPAGSRECPGKYESPCP